MPRVLVVADETWTRNRVHAALSEPGFELRDVTDPTDVVTALRDNDPDVVVVDLQIASKGGMAITRSLRHAEEIDGIDHVPVVLLLDRRADAFIAKRAGAEAWVQKPFAADELRRALVTATERAAEEAATE
jgi:DNA-binding response OmpR family regulator